MTSASALLGQGLKVEIDFASNTSITDSFTLDDATKGKLDNVTYTLGEAYADVSHWVTETLNVTRGRSRETDSFQAGTATVVLRNEDRRFDPSNTSSPYYPGIQPMTRIRITLAGNIIFSGFVEDFGVTDDPGPTSTCVLQCVDGFGILANAMITTESLPKQNPAPRVDAILTAPEVSYPDPWDTAGMDQSTLDIPGGTLTTPSGVAIDSSGNAYIVDSSTNRVYKWNGSTLTTLANTGLSSPSSLSSPWGICIDSSNNLYVSDTVNNRVVKWNGSSWSSMAISSGLASPLGVAVRPDGTFLYVADSGNNRIQQEHVGTGVVTVGFSGLSTPISVALDHSNNIYTAELGGSRVVKWDGSSQSVITMTGAVGHNGGLAIDNYTNIYFSDRTDGPPVVNQVLRYHRGTVSIAGLTGLDHPTGLFADNFGNVWVADFYHARIVTTNKNVNLLGAHALHTEFALDHLRLVERSEYAYLYCDRLGTLQFRPRTPATAAAQVKMADDGSGLPYQAISRRTANLMLYTQVTGQTSDPVSPSTGAVQTSISTNVGTYFTRTYQLPSMACANDTDVKAICDSILDLYENPEIRIDTIAVELERLSSGNQTAMTALDLTQLVEVVRTPPGGGGAIDLVQLIEQVQWDLNAAAGTYRCTLTLGSIGA